MSGATGFTATNGFLGVAAGAVAATLTREPEVEVDDPIHVLVEQGHQDQDPDRDPDPEPDPDRGSRSGFLRRAVRVAGTLLLLGMVTVFTLVAVLPATGARAMIVLSGSMEPLLSAGDAAVIRDVPPSELKVGDVITFHGIGADKRLTTHRIIDVVLLDSGLHFQTQGDANTSPDVDLAPAAGVVGRYDGRIPHGGRALLLLSKPEAKILLVAVPALLILAGEIRALVATALARQRRQTAAPARRIALAGAMLLASAALGVTVTMATVALMTDADDAGNNSFSTGTFS